MQIGDSNSRIQAAASDAILHLAKLKESGLQGMAATFIKPQKCVPYREFNVHFCQHIPCLVFKL